MYPPCVSPDTNSLGEIELFEQSQNNPVTQNWVVLHFLDMAKHIQQRDCGIDFVIFIPNKGVFVMF